MAKAVRIAGSKRPRTAKQAATKSGEILPPPASDKSTLSIRGRFEVTQGLLPPPAMLKNYDVVVPGAAKRIMDRFEKDTQHRRTQESRGLYFGFCILILVIACGIGPIFALAWYGKASLPTVSGIMGITAICVALTAANLIKAWRQK